jgi:hypothetical protein
LGCGVIRYDRWSCMTTDRMPDGRCMTPPPSVLKASALLGVGSAHKSDSELAYTQWRPSSWFDQGSTPLV